MRRVISHADSISAGHIVWFLDSGKVQETIRCLGAFEQSVESAMRGPAYTVGDMDWFSLYDYLFQNYPFEQYFHG